MTLDRHLWWYLARASGLVAAALVVLTAGWGLLLATRVLRRRGLPAWADALHRHLGALTLTFIGLHMAALAADSYLTFSWSELLVPFASPWRRWATGAGVVAMWLLVAVEATSLVRARLPRRWWRGVHLCSYAALAAVALHTVTAGTDATNPVLLAAGTTTVVVLGVLIARRSVRGRLTGRPGPPAAPPPAAPPSRPTVPPAVPPTVSPSVPPTVPPPYRGPPPPR